MNVYDFDGTIYAGDSTIDFYLFCIVRHPKVLKALPKQLLGGLRYCLKLIDKKTFKEYFYSFLEMLDEPESKVADFWFIYKKKIYSWYLFQKQEDDVIISASPEFLLQPICSELGIRELFASNVDIATGKYKGENCKGQEKVNRFKSAYGECTIDSFFSDSISDAPLAQLSEKAYLVKNGVICEWHIK